MKGIQISAYCLLLYRFVLCFAAREATIGPIWSSSQVATLPIKIDAIK